MSSLLDAYRLLHDGALALAEAERAGIRIDVEYCREKAAWLDEQMRRSDRRLRSSQLGRTWLKRFERDTSWGSGKQLQAVLYADLGVKSFKKTLSDQDSVDEESLKQSQVDGIEHLLRQRSLKKMSDVLHQFVRYQIDGRLYPNFHLHTVVTYRSSSSEPNLQNAPKRDKEQMDICRRAIVPSLGNVLLELDFKAIEVGVAACYHKDPTMLEYLRSPASDMHADTAVDLFLLTRPVPELRKIDGFGKVLRQAAKNGFVFPQFYGDYYEHCAENIASGHLKLPRVGSWSDSDGIEFDCRPMGWHMRQHGIFSLSDFTAHVKQVENRMWNERFPVYSKWRKNWYESYQKLGSFQMKTGFVCSGVMVRNAAVNYPVQGAAFHVLLKTLTLLVRYIRGWKSRVIGEVHDSILVDADPAEVCVIIEIVSRIASEELPKMWDWVCVPLAVESSVSKIDGSWADMEEVR